MLGKELAEKILRGDKKALAKSMTLICSHLEQDKKESKILLEEILKKSNPSYRVGISGIGGVGKSTFIEALGSYVLKENPKVKLGILTVDPSSPESGGSILADSVRMTNLVAHEQVFIRSISNSTALGGLNKEAYELTILLEGIGCDYIFLESVGTGQSDDRISLLSDTSIQLQMPASGDNMQAIKKGALEKADILVVHKYDGLLEKEAMKTALLYKQREQLLSSTRSYKSTPVFLVSSLEEKGLAETWSRVCQHQSESLTDKKHLQEKNQKILSIFYEQLFEEFKEKILQEKKFAREKKEIQKKLEERKISPLFAAREFLEELF